MFICQMNTTSHPRLQRYAGWLAVTVLGLAGISIAWPDDDASAVPTWFRTSLAELAQGSGRWIADNARHRSDGEPFDAYGIEWRWGLGKQSLTGRLFGLQEGKEVADFWEFRIYWDGAGGTGVIEQFAGHGVVGRGALVGFGDGTLTDQTFTDAQGRQWRELHHSWFERDTHVTQSFEWKDGAWLPKRTYR